MYKFRVTGENAQRMTFHGSEIPQLGADSLYGYFYIIDFVGIGYIRLHEFASSLSNGSEREARLKSPSAAKANHYTIP
jgi:hypothetical protein